MHQVSLAYLNEKGVIIVTGNKAATAARERTGRLEEILKSIEPSELLAIVDKRNGFGTNRNYVLSVTPTDKGLGPAQSVAMNLYGFILRALNEVKYGGVLDWHITKDGNAEITYSPDGLEKSVAVAVVSEEREEQKAHYVRVRPLQKRVGPYELADVIKNWRSKLTPNQAAS